MKKLFIAVAAMALVACGGGNNTGYEVQDVLGSEQNDSLAEIVKQVIGESENVAPEVKAAIENDEELKVLVEKAEVGELSDEEKLNLWQRLKKIGAEVVLGQKTVEGGAAEAAEELKGAGAEELKDAAQKVVDDVKSGKAAEKVQKAAEDIDKAKQKVEETKQKVEDVKNAVNGVKGALDALKK